jgi:hypothetical protein
MMIYTKGFIKFRFSETFPFFLGYVQGMSDLLSPLLYVMENEVDAFWCFASYMDQMVSRGIPPVLRPTLKRSVMLVPETDCNI